MKYIFLFLLSLTSLKVYSEQKPNILFMMADDQGWNGLSVQMHPDMGSSKHPYIQTPVLAKLAR